MKDGKEMKSVLIAIRPKWVKLIAEGKKTVEVRKTKPKIDVPFKCYIYCTKDKKNTFFTKQVFDGEKGKWAIPYVGNGNVIGEFVCRSIDEITPDFMFGYLDYLALEDTCLEIEEIQEYGQGKKLYGWNISNLIIYDKPKELSEFQRACENENCGKCKRKITEKLSCIAGLTRPPQSWMYCLEYEEVTQ